MVKILLIGQAPPAVKQQLPYDTTMLYDWLSECGVSKEQAQSMFQFDAIYGQFPGFDSNGGHLKPTEEQMDQHWDNHLELEVQVADKVWILGNVAKNYIDTKEKTWSCNTEFLYTIHPSKRNFSLYLRNKQQIINSIRAFINS